MSDYVVVSILPRCMFQVLLENIEMFHYFLSHFTMTADQILSITELVRTLTVYEVLLVSHRLAANRTLLYIIVIATRILDSLLSAISVLLTLPRLRKETLRY